MEIVIRPPSMSEFSECGRFLSQDPVFQEINQYSYTLGNPVWWGDPDGEMSTYQGWNSNTIGGFAACIGLVCAAAGDVSGNAGLSGVGWILSLIGFGGWAGSQPW